jgi:hypothetical protein
VHEDIFPKTPLKSGLWQTTTGQIGRISYLAGIVGKTRQFNLVKMGVKLSAGEKGRNKTLHIFSAKSFVEKCSFSCDKSLTYEYKSKILKRLCTFEEDRHKQNNRNIVVRRVDVWTKLNLRKKNTKKKTKKNRGVILNVIT